MEGMTQISKRAFLARLNWGSKAVAVDTYYRQGDECRLVIVYSDGTERDFCGLAANDEQV